MKFFNQHLLKSKDTSHLADVRGNVWNQKFVFLHIFCTLFILFIFFNPIVAPVAEAQVLDFADRIGGQLLGALSKFGDATIGLAFREIAGIFFRLAGFFSSVGAGSLDLAINFSLDSANYKDLAGIRVGWTVFRDLANMTFIFIILYIAVTTVLQIAGASTKRILASLIMVALLVNFSFFLTGFVVDTGNILGGFLYRSITPPIDPQVPNGPRFTLGGIFTQHLHLSSVVDEKQLSTLSNTQKGMINLLGAVVLLVAAFIFLSGAILFILRTVVLMFVLILSPLAFVAAILPQTKRYWSMWFGKLLSNTFVAPVYLLLLTAIVLIITSDQLEVATGVRDQAGVIKSTMTFSQMFNFSSSGYAFGDHAPILLNYVLILGLLIGSVVISKQMAGGIANISTKWAGKITGAGMGAAAGATAWGLRNTAGRGLREIAASKWLQNQLGEDKSKLRRYGARMALTATTAGAKASYDARSGKTGTVVRAATGASLANAALGNAGVNINAGKAGGKGGYDGQEKARQKHDAELVAAMTVSKPTSAEQKTLDDMYKKLTVARNVGDKDKIKDIEEMIKIAEGKISRRGEEKKEQFAQDLANPPFSFKPTRVRKARAAAIRKKKSTAQTVLDALKDDEETPSSTPPSSTPPSSTPPSSGPTP